MHYLIMGEMHLRGPTGSRSALSALQRPLCVHSVSERKGRLLLPGDDLTSRFWSARRLGSASSRRLMFPALSGTNLLRTCHSPTGSQIKCYDGNRWFWVDSFPPSHPDEGRFNGIHSIEANRGFRSRFGLISCRVLR